VRDQQEGERKTTGEPDDRRSEDREDDTREVGTGSEDGDVQGVRVWTLNG